MMTRFLGLIIISAVLCSALVSMKQEKKICITVDDLPLVTYGLKDAQFDQRCIAKFLTTLKHYKIPAIGYVNESQLYADGQLNDLKVKLLEQWVSAGYDLGNHTYSHFDYNKVSDSIFFDDILKGESITRPLLQQHNKQLVYFRHPFLHTGASQERQEALNLFLQKHGYTEAPVTIDTDDYYFAKAYHLAYTSGDTESMARIGVKYLAYMESKLIFFEKKSEALFHRQISQTLLIHANLLNADYLDDLAQMYRRHGYTFISQAEVLKDPAYSTQVKYYTPKGISWIFRWAYSEGKGEEFSEGDVTLPELH